ncbi:uncharacterized protein LOC131246223 isoform X2 [Magnolia sinica]|uniref:uncharacterized protein LOC131246223 isoform X2 n=1 Tax=Magnolia sinica TaxID=86752 RepID=UPI00265AABAA|nr:uncharacterized protein LOC131246223 isoform X2 [Magnolia sinica]
MRLFLPPKFHRRAVALVDQSTLLEDMRGQQWRVKLSMVDGSLAFQQGWDKFVSDHSVKFGEILVFNYIVGSHFLVQIFGTSTLERLNFSTRNNGNHHKGKQARARKPSPDCSPSIKMPRYMVDTDAMNEKGATMNEEEATGSRTPPCNSSNFEMSESTDKAPTPMEKYSNYASSSKRTSDISVIPRYVIDEDSMNEVGAARSRTALDFEMIGNKCDAETPDKLPTKPGKSADHDSGSKMTLDDEEGAARSRSASLSSCDVEILGTRCNAVDTQKSVLEVSSRYKTRSKKSFDVVEAPFHKDGGYSANEERAAKSRMAPSNSSDFKMVESKCDAEDSNKIPTSKKSSDCAVSSKRKLKMWMKSIVDNDSVIEGASRNNAAHSNLSDFEMIRNKPDAEVMKNVPRRTETSHHDGSSKMTCDALQKAFNVIDKDLDEGDVRSPPRPSCMSNNEGVALKCDAGDREQVPNAKEESSHHENSCKSTFDASDTACYLIDGDSIKEEGAAFQSKCNTEHVDEVPKSIVKSSNSAVSCKMKQEMRMKYSGEKNSVHEEAASRSRAFHSNSPDSGVIGNKCEDEGMEKVPKTTEKSHDDSSKMNSDASQNPCYMIDEDSVSKEGATRCETAPLSFPDTGIIETKCADEKDEVMTTMEESSPFKNSSKRTSVASELPRHMIEGDSMNGGVDRSGNAPSNSHGFNMADGNFSAEDVDMIPISKRMPDASELPSGVIDDDMTNAEGDARSRTAPLSFTGFKMFDGECHPEYLDKEQETTENSSHLENSSGRLQTMSMIGYSENENGSVNISDAGSCRYPLSDEQKCTYSGNEPVTLPKMELDDGNMGSALETNVNASKCHEYPLTMEEKHCPSGNEPHSVLEDGQFGSCSKVELKHCKVEPEESLDSIEFSTPNDVCFCCSMSESSLSRLELPTYIPSALTKGRKKHKRAVLFLRDPAMRVWPVLYHENKHKRILGSGWSSFAAANNLKEGDACTFEVADNSQAMLQVHISRR